MRTPYTAPVPVPPSTLIIDLASHASWIGIVHRGTATVRALPEKRNEAEILPALTALCHERIGGIDPLRALERIVAIVGPGGFMSLRVGVAIANALSWSLKVPLAGLTLRDLWMAQMQPHDNVLWLHSTKRDALFVCGCGAWAATWPVPTLVGLETLQAELRSSPVASVSFVGEVLPSQQSALPALCPFPSVDRTAILPTIVDALSYDTKPLEPWYGRNG